MQLRFTEADERFRGEVSDWLSDNLAGDFSSIRHRGGPGDEHVFVEERKAWEKCLAEGGWTCIGWPEAWGGKDATIEQQVIFNEEYARAGGPGRVGHIGETLTGPTLLAFGSEAQKQRYLPGIRAGKELWCQGYSEPTSGSDLASLKLKASSAGDNLILNGSKIWTTHAHYANRMFILVRTNDAGKPQDGITFLLLDMDSPGITVEPILFASGTHEVNQVFFDNVYVPKQNIVGQENQGWTVAKYLLEFERGGGGAAPAGGGAMSRIEERSHVMTRAPPQSRERATLQPACG